MEFIFSQMIIAETAKPTLNEFKDLMKKVDALLNEDAQKRPEYYLSKLGTCLEPVIRDAATECAKGTEFEGTIDLISGSSFPDIVAAKYYGVEVKSTKSNHWTSIGSSILESTRIQDVERIYLTFGKMGSPVEFLSRPYEECLSGIAVTHYPRYQIDMKLKAGESIFDKMNIPYDTLRTLENPVEPVAAYYKSKLKPGESLWWTSGTTEEVNASVSATVKLWSALTRGEKDYYESRIYAFFPECILSSSSRKYDRGTLWLATQGIINKNLRDSFSAGGKVMMDTMGGVSISMPKVFKNVKDHIKDIISVIDETSPTQLCEYWDCGSMERSRFQQWISLIVSKAKTDSFKIQAESVLKKILCEAGYQVC